MEKLNRALNCLANVMTAQANVNIAKHIEFWLKLKDGTSMPVYSVVKDGKDCFTVYGYDGKTCQLEKDADEDSADELVNLIVYYLWPSLTLLFPCASV